MHRLLLLLLLPACLERTETIVVAVDGAVAITHRIKGHPGDLDGGPAAIPLGGPWELVARETVREDGEDKAVLTTRGRFPRAAAVPTTFGGARGLTFTTSVATRREDGRTVIVFERRYGARTWAPYARIERRHLTDEVRALVDDAESLPERSAEERRKVLQAFADAESDKLQFWGGRGLAAAFPDHPRGVEARLAGAHAVRTYFAADVTGAKLLGVLSKSAEEIDALTQRVHAESKRRYVAAAGAALGTDDAGRARLAAAIDLEQRDFDVTHDLGDEIFIVRLKLPGRVLRHDGARLEDGFVVWEFDDEDLRDRAHVLSAVAVVGE